MSLQPGREIERYVVQGLLGEGGMAEVYRVRHGTLGTHHALKVLTITSRSVRARLVQEGQLQATLHHPNIVAVTDVLEIDGAPGLLMEFIEGPALDTWLRSYRPSVDEALAVFGGILAGVKSAHDKGLIHRDLKPANVMMAIDAGAVIPKVADFGLAKAMESDGPNKTKSGSTMGTPAYMAPEQIRDASKVDQRADIFSLGCILYELVCGQQCFQGDDILTLFNKIANADFIPPKELVPDLPENVEDAILGCLEIEVGQRIPDCKTLQSMLESLDNNGPRIPMPTILPEEAPGAEAARSMVSLVPFEAVAATPSHDTWLSEPMTATPAPVHNVVHSGSISRDATEELQTELVQMRRQNIMVMGGSLMAVGVAAIAVLTIGALVVGWTMVNSAPTETTVAVAPTVPDPDQQKANEAAKAEAAKLEAQQAAKEKAANEQAARLEAQLAEAQQALRDQTESASKKQPIQRQPIKKAPVRTPVKEPEIIAAPVVEVVKAPPPPPKPTGGTLIVTGDARIVMLDGPSGKFKSNESIPKGDYTILAWFGATQPVTAGRLTITGTETVTLKCVGMMAQCVRQ